MLSTNYTWSLCIGVSRTCYTCLDPTGLLGTLVWQDAINCNADHYNKDSPSKSIQHEQLLHNQQSVFVQQVTTLIDVHVDVEYPIYQQSYNRITQWPIVQKCSEKFLALESISKALLFIVLANSSTFCVLQLRVPDGRTEGNGASYLLKAVLD